MFPSVALHAGSAAEIAIGVLFVLATAGIGWARRSHPDVMRLFVSYVASALGAGLLLHALLGRGVLVVSSYALVLVAGATLGCALLLRRLVGRGLPEGFVQAFLLRGFVAALIASRVAAVLPTLTSFRSWGEWSAQLVDPRGGLSVFGAIVTAAVYVPLVLRRRRELSAASVLDACASTLALVIGIGRGGCLLAGCCFGAVTSAGWWALPARAFDPDSPAGVAYAADPAVHVWATQPLEGVAVLGIALGCEALYRRRRALRLPPGAVFAAGIGAYGLVRVAVETVRADSPHAIAGIFTVWQVVGLAACLAVGAWGVRAASRVSPAAAGSDTWQ